MSEREQVLAQLKAGVRTFTPAEIQQAAVTFGERHGHGDIWHMLLAFADLLVALDGETP